MKVTQLTILIFLFILGNVSAQNADTVLTYKYLDSGDSLQLHFFYSAGSGEELSPAMIFYFGGGWNGGSVDQFRPHAEYFSNRGMVCILAEYRIKTKHGTSPFESVMDAKSAMRYVRAKAAFFSIDSHRIAAAGGSAGGHLAIACATIDAYDDPNDPVDISPVPNALILFNPVYDNGPNGYGYDRIGEKYPSFSPMHNLYAGMPPVIVFLGDEDPLIPVATALDFNNKMTALENQTELWLFPGQKHGFFNAKFPPYFKATVFGAEKFLAGLQWISLPVEMTYDSSTKWKVYK